MLYEAEGRNDAAIKKTGTREDPFVDCYLAASRSPLLGVSLALNCSRHDTANLRTPLLYAPLRLPRLFEAIKCISFAAVARN